MADIREQTPVSNKVQAGVKHMGDGTKLALAFIKDAQEQAKLEVKVAANMKGKLEKLAKLTTEELNGFCAAMNDKRKEIEAEAKNSGFDKVTDYYTSGTVNGSVANSLNVTISLWVKIAIALTRGWKPDTKKPWAVLSKEATQFKNGAPRTPDKPETDAERKLREAKEQQELVKKVERTVEQSMVVKDGDTVTGMTETARSALPDVVASIVKWASVEEIEACIQRLTILRDAAIKARDDMAKAVAKAGMSAHAESGTGEPAKATAATTGNERPGADELVEHARAVTRSQSRNKRAKQHA